jgi:DDE superfamily endonuclease
MEDVREVDARPDAPRRPQICRDEVATQLLREVRPPLPAAPGRAARSDCADERGGVVNVFLFCAPLGAPRWTAVTAQRTEVDGAHQLKDLVDVRYPQAERIVRVLDNLNTHTPVSLDEAFPPAEAQRLADKLEIHHTPQHGSWLNSAESELSVRAAVPRAASPRCGHAPGGHPRLARAPWAHGHDRRLALHDGGRPDQAQAPLPISSGVTEY